MQEINNATGQENIAQINSSINMEETRTDGQQAVTTETMPTEQANVQLPTAEGDVDQKNEVPQPINESPFVLGRWYGINGEVVDVQSPTTEGDVDQQIEETAQEPSYVETLLSLVGDKLPKNLKYAIKYSEARKAGLKVVFLKGNREIYNTQLEALWKSAKGQKHFSNGCYVVPLRPILEKFPGIEAYDLDGNQVTLDSPDADMCLVVYDGQHRIAVCELHPGEIDVLLELNEFDGCNPLDTIKLMNSFSKNWSGTDLRVSNVGSGVSTNKLYEESENLQGLYDITSKLAEYILTFKREATKKKDLVDGKDTTIYVDEHGNRGRGIFNATMTNFGGAKEVKKIELMDSIVETYNSVKDTEKPTFARNMKLFMGTMAEPEREKVKKLITDKDYGTLNSVINKGYTDFCSAGHTEETLLQMEAGVDKAIADYVTDLQKKNQEKAAKKPLKCGRVHEVIQHKRAVETKIANEKSAKAKKASLEDQEAQVVVDNLKKESDL